MSFKPFGNNSFVLANSPYHSRVDQHENNPPNDIARNYSMAAYKPGQPLQSGELNEVQEHFYRMMSLTTQMNHNWLAGPGLLWDADYGTDDSIIPENAVGVGQNDGTGLTVHGPGWAGTTPLYPFNDPSDTSTNTNIIEVVMGGSNITVVCKIGWYLVEPISGELEGMKIWVHNNTDLTLENLPKDGQNYNVGFKVSVHYIDSSEDPSLKDQTGSGSPMTAATADRIQLRINDISSNDSSASPILKVYTNGSTLAPQQVRYMNNLLIKDWA